MSEHNYFVIFLKKINLVINSQLKKYLNKLNFKNLLNITSSNKFFLTFIAVNILFLSYLSIPHVYNKLEIQKKLENQLLDKYSLNFNLSKNLRYKFFPRPHFISENSSIFQDQLEVSSIKKLQIFISLKNLFFLEGINIKEVILENTNFNLDKQNSDFFIKLLDNSFLESNFSIKDSNVFFRNNNKEVLFINKIISMKYYYDSRELKNIVNSENEIFNIQYFFKAYKDQNNNKIFSKINFKVLKLQIENELSYNTNKIKGFSDVIYKKNKSKSSYYWNKNSFNFNYYDKLTDPKFFYKGKINFNPFDSILEGNTYKIDLSNFFDTDSLFFQLLKTEILNNKNLNIDFKINSNEIIKYPNFIDVILNFKIQEGLIDINNTRFSWNDYVDFEILNSLLYVNKNQLILDGKLILDIRNYDEIYKFLQISKNLRPELKNLEFNFNYNFDQQIINFDTIKVDNKINKRFNNIIKKIILKKDRLKNKIYFKNLMKKVIIAYVG